MPATDTRFPNDRIIVTAFLIEHPEGLFLFDTGFSATHWQAVETFAPVDIRPIRTLLSENGIRAADVRMIPNCHFHIDPSTGTSNCPAAPTFAQRPPAPTL